jgi:hypothetical protein
LPKANNLMDGVPLGDGPGPGAIDVDQGNEPAINYQFSTANRGAA